MQYKFDRHIEHLLSYSGRPPKILAAVSGGADSMCLLNLLCNSSLDISVSIAHVNFNLRGEESCKDEELVKGWAKEHNVQCFVKSTDTIKYAKEHSLSVEMAARELRYSWFEELLDEYGFDYVAVAHHANDNAETLLLNLVRGTGIHGICGMKAVDNKRKILRPLLAYTRREIEKYVALHNVPFRTDHTNLESDFYRNRIRNNVMPQLEMINPSAIPVLNRDMRYFTYIAHLADDLWQDKRQRLVHSDCNTGSEFLDIVKSGIAKQYIATLSAPYLVCYISVKELLEETDPEYWLYCMLDTYSFNSSQIDDFTAALHSIESKRIISASHIAVKERGFIKVYRKAIGNAGDSGNTDSTCSAGNYGNCAPVEIYSGKEDVAGSKMVTAGVVELSFEAVCAGSGKALQYLEERRKKYPLSIMFSADNLSFPIFLRKAERGDRWRPLGMRGVKKLSDYLNDIKIDTLLKNTVCVLCCGDEPCAPKNNPGNIICVPGLQVSDLYRVTENTTIAVIVSVTGVSSV